MAFFRGEEGSVKFSSTGGTVAEVLSTTSWSLDTTKDTLDVTSHGKVAREFVGGLTSGSGTVEVLYTAATGETNNFTTDALGTNDPADAKFELFLDDNSGSSDKKITFDGIVTGASFSSSVGDLSTVSVSFVTSGAINVSAI